MWNYFLLNLHVFWKRKRENISSLGPTSWQNNLKEIVKQPCFNFDSKATFVQWDHNIISYIGISIISISYKWNVLFNGHVSPVMFVPLPPARFSPMAWPRYILCCWLLCWNDPLEAFCWAQALATWQISLLRVRGGAPCMARYLLWASKASSSNPILMFEGCWPLWNGQWDFTLCISISSELKNWCARQPAAFNRRPTSLYRSAYIILFFSSLGGGSCHNR